MDVFLMAGVHQQPDQSNYLAEGRTWTCKLVQYSAISFRTLWTIFWLAKTSNKPISLTTWLAV